MLSSKLRKNDGKFPDFEIQEFQELQENSETKILIEIHRPDAVSGPVGPKT